MRSLDRARQQALRYRPLLGEDPDCRLERLCEYLKTHHDIEPVAVGKSFLQGGQGEIAPEEGFLYYDKKLDQKPREKLELFAHELGHLVLHKRLTQALVPGDPIRGSAFLEHGAPALARYSRRSYEEAEASAFAAELLCPADEVFRRWRSEASSTLKSLAESFGVSLGLLRVQLAEGLLRSVSGTDGEPSEGGWETLLMNDDQERAATSEGCPVLVEAGPGTGKTRTLVRRVIHLIRERQVAAEEILVLTFSNEAAEELRSRLDRNLGTERASEILIATFHGLGILILHSFGHLVDLGSEFAVLDELSQEDLLSEILGRVDCDAILNLRNPQETARRASYFIGYLKDRLYTPERLAAEIDGWRPGRHERQNHARAKALLAVFQAYEEEKRRLDRVDFADLILLPLLILEEQEDVRERFRTQCRWVMVDEYQDVSRSMARLLQGLCGAQNPPWVVGDARQAIYRFRGAAPENVRRFTEDFPGGKTFLIRRNYRSSPPVIDTANLLAALFEDDAFETEPPQRWRPGRSIEALEPRPVVIFEANSDAAERRAIVDQVREWRRRGISAGEIGVLARRNIDVRNIALALSESGIRAVTNGLLTAEGAAGDLAAAVTLLDAPRAAIPRLLAALGRGQARRDEINEATRVLLEVLEEEEKTKREEKTRKDEEEAPEPGRKPSDAPGDPWASSGGAVRHLGTTAQELLTELRRLEYSGDGWAVLCAFLFDSPHYLRPLLAQSRLGEGLTDEEQGLADEKKGFADEKKGFADEKKGFADEEQGLAASVALEEIVSALAFAGSYRFGHPGIRPRRARLKMAESFRDLLCNAAPGLIPPRPQAGAVRVMTCHASKGLEFPCVIVAGQTLNLQETDDSWLPPAWRENPQAELEQADSLLFVGVTRAERALVVSYARSAGGTVRSPKRTVPGLLEKWMKSKRVPLELRLLPTEPEGPVELDPVWGGNAPERVSMYALSGNQCAIRGYLEDFLDLRLRPVSPSLYPVFATRVSRALRRITAEANARGAALEPHEAEAIAQEEWPEDQYADHPHIGLYRPRALLQAKEFARVYRPQKALFDGFADKLVWRGADDQEVDLPLRLIGRFREPQGNQVAVLYRPESLASGEKAHVSWSKLKEHHRLPLVLLHEEDPTLLPYVYSGEDGRFYPYKWSVQKPRETLKKEAQRAREIFTARNRGELKTPIKDWSCDRCSSRMLCPFWLGATEER